MTTTPRPAPVLWILLSLACGPATASAQAPARPREGIDVVFLVDVSGSMYHLPARGAQPGNGNDPQRIRWDAVLLSLNLLTAEDRVAVVPFNQDAPAICALTNNTQAWVPGWLRPELSEARSAEGSKTRETVRRFIHTAQPGEGQANEFNGDIGGTAILSALDFGRNLLHGARAPEGPAAAERQRFVILLTDGQEASPNKPGPLAHLGTLDTLNRPDLLSQLYNDPALLKWLDAYGDLQEPGQAPARVKVYTIGLGQPPFDGTLLRMIATRTGGHYHYVQSNGELIDTFRKLIWQLKGSWTKGRPLPPSAPGQELDLMAGIRGVGALYYRIARGQAPRNYFQVEAADEPGFAWADRAGARLDVAPTFRASEQSYAYGSYEHAGTEANPRPFDEGDQLATGWKASGAERHVWFSKRTVLPLFRTADDMSRGTFVRYEAMPVRVVMNQQSRFRPEEFALEASVKTTGEPEERELRKPEPMRFDPSSGQFLGDIDLNELQSRGGETDDYTLVVTARGRGDRNHSLLNYTLELPPVDIRVENRLRLRPVGPVRVTNRRDAQRPTIRLRPERPFRLGKGARPLWLKAELAHAPTDAQGRPVELVRVPARVQLREGPAGLVEAELVPELHGNHRVGLYPGGELLVSAADPAYPKMAPLSIPLQVAVDTKRLGLSRAGVRLEYEKGDPVRSDPLQVMFDGQELKDGPQVTVAIPTQHWGADELWLELDGATGPGAPQLKLPASNAAFRVAFRPKENHNTPLQDRKIGYYAFDLNIAVDSPGYERDPAGTRVQLYYNAPKLVVTPPGTITLQRGRPQVVELRVALQGVVPAARRVTFGCRNPVTGVPEAPLFRNGPDQQEYVRLEAEEDLALTAAGQPTARPLRLRLFAPKDLPCGDYTLVHGEVSADLTEPVPVGLHVQVNDLDVQDAAGRPVTGALEFLQVKGKPLVRTVRVFAELGELATDALDVIDDRRFLNVDKNTENAALRVKVVSRERCRDAKGRAGVALGLALPDPGPSFEQYSGTAVIRRKTPELQKPLDFVVQQVDFLRPADTAPAKRSNP